MIVGLDHVGVAVEDLEAALETYRDVLGLQLVEISVAEEDKVKSAMLRVGEVNIELMEPTGEDSPVAKFLQKRGEGIHHLALKVRDINSFLLRLKKAGVKLIDEKPRRGVEGGDIAFIHPKSTRRVLLELCERR